MAEVRAEQIDTHTAQGVSKTWAKTSELDLCPPVTFHHGEAVWIPQKIHKFQIYCAVGRPSR